MKKLKITSFIFLSLLFNLILTVVFQPLATAQNTAPTLRWAADTESGAPFVFQDPQNLEQLMGFEYDIITAIAREIGMKPVFVQNAWDGLVPGLQRDQYDVIINGIEITPDRADEIAFSKPYFGTYEQLVVRHDEKEITTLAGCAGRKVGTLKLSVAERILQKTPGVEVISYEAETNIFSDLRNKRIDAVLIDEPIAKYYAAPNPAFKLIGEPYGDIEYGIGIRKSDHELKNKIDQALAKLTASGELRNIYQRWNLWNPYLAKFFNDSSTTSVQPTQYEYFLEHNQEERTWRDRAALYWKVLPILARGALTTLQISIAAMGLAVALGLLLALTRLYGPQPLAWLTVCYIELMRGTPLLIQLFFIYYALPHIGLKMSPWSAAILGLGLNYAANEAENYRAGIQAIPKAQSEASLALGLSTLQSIRHVILPQALRIVIPPITNDFISLLKDSSLVSVITMVELTKLYGQLASTYYDYIGIGILTAIFYLLLGLPFVRLARWLETKLLNGHSRA